MKKVICMILAAMMIVTLAACGSKEEAPPPEAPAEAETPAKTPEEQPLEPTGEANIYLLPKSTTSNYWRTVMAGAEAAAKELGIDFSTCKFTPEEWLAGLNVELEHGTVAPATDITGDDLMATAKIALAHLNTTPAYYNAKSGLEAWKTSLRKGVKSRSKKTEFKTLSFKADAYDEETGVFSGYAAVYGRNSLPWRDRLKLDAHYVRNLSFALDAKVFFRTFAVVLGQKGVYVEEGDGASPKDEDRTSS